MRLKLPRYVSWRPIAPDRTFREGAPLQNCPDIAPYHCCPIIEPTTDLRWHDALKSSCRPLSLASESSSAQNSATGPDRNAADAGMATE